MENLNVLQQRIEDLQKENSELRQMAERDGLTGCLRREALLKILERRRGFGLLAKKQSLVVADIDFFKKVNDNFGHLAGDEVLKAFAQHLMSSLPDGSLVARMGGEEFLILMNEDLTDARHYIEEIRQNLAARPITSSDGEKIAVTASFGMAQWDSDESMLKAVAQADGALYQSKKNGRNRLSLAA